RSKIFQATNIATVTALTLPVNRHMSKFRRCAACTLHDLPVDDHASSNARADGEIDHILAAPPCAKHKFAQPCCIGVILYKNRNLEMFVKNIAQWNAVPSR